jgi:hypothetical protein
MIRTMLLYFFVLTIYSCNSQNHIADEQNSFNEKSFIRNWKTLQGYVKTSDTTKIANLIEFPIHLEEFALFHFSVDCDTLKFISNESKYMGSSISKASFNEYYSFVFDENLSSYILNTSADEILLNQSNAIVNSGITIRLKTNDFNNYNCPNDHSIRLHFYFSDDHWYLRFGVL